MNLTIPQHNCEKTVIRLIRCQKINITDTTIRTSLEAHPDYPSLLSISDFLHSYNIENIALKTRVENFAEFPVPFIAHISKPPVHEKVFALVHEVNQNSILYEDIEKERMITENINDFKQKFTGNALLIDGSEALAEKDFNTKKRAEKVNDIASITAIFALPILILAYIISLFVAQPFNNIILPALFLLSTFAGATVSFLLILFEIDNHNPLLKEICQGGKKVNCLAVLQSKASGIMGIRWSNIGFCYFAGMLLAQMFAGATNGLTVSLLSFLNLLSLPYIFFSIYYQWRVVKQWCLLCLTIQTVLVLQLVVAIAGGFYSLDFATMPIATSMQLLISFVLPTLILYVTIPALKTSKEGREHYNALQRYKNNAQVFQAILGKQREIQHSADGLGITLGNPNAAWKIIKICNPYCGPCAKAHPIVDELVAHNQDAHLQIIFTATGDDDDFKTAPVRHLLAIASKGDELLTKQSLDGWYNTHVKDYPAFAKKYPIEHKVLSEQKEKTKAMKTWCDAQEISFTPTFFINGFQLPEMYSLSDMKFLLTDYKM